MTALAYTVFVGTTKYPAGTDHTDMPAEAVAAIRNGEAWVGGVAPPYDAPPPTRQPKPILSMYELTSGPRLLTALGFSLDDLPGGEDPGGPASFIDWANILNKPAVFPAAPPAWVNVTGKPSTFPPSGHSHATSEVTGLDNALAGKAAAGHTHTTSQVSGLDFALSGKADTEALAGKANVSHTHATGDVTGLDTALAGKASTSHTHTAGQVSGLAPVATSGAFGDLVEVPAVFPHAPITWDEIEGKPTTFPGGGEGGGGTGGSVSWGDVTGKPSTFPPSAHQHPTTDITGLSSALAAKADASALAAKADASALAGKADAVHSHTTADVSGLDTALAGKSDSGHTHTAGQVSGLATVAKTGAYADLTGLPTIPPAAPVQSVAGKTGAVTLAKGDVGLSAVDNTADADKPISTATASALAGKAATSHQHAAGDITSGTLPTGRGGTGMNSFTAGGYVRAASSSALEQRTAAQVLSDIGAAAAAHSHATSDVSGLDTALAGKAAASHAHATSDVTGLDTALAGKASTTHTHSAGDIASGTLGVARGGTGLSSLTAGGYVRAASSSALEQRTAAQVLSDIGAAAATHSHATSDVSGLDTALAGKASTSHTHTAGQVTGLATVATSGSYNDLTDKPTGGGGSSAWSSITGRPDYLADRANALRTWRAALADRHYNPAKIAVIADSLSEGVGAGAYGRGWVPMLLGQLRMRYPVTGVTGGPGFVCSWDNPGVGAPPAYSYPVVVSPNNFTFLENAGFAMKSWNMQATNETMTYTFTGTSIHVWYLLQSGGGSFSITLDGTVVASSVSTAGTAARGIWTSAALTPGTHTIVLTRLSGSCRINGFRVHDGDEARGIQMFNGSQSSRQAAEFVAQASTGGGWADWINTIQPHLCIIELGLNDWGNGATQSVLKANLKSIISTVRARTSTNPSFVIYASPQVNSGPYTMTYAQLHQVWEEVAAEDTGVCLLDIAARFRSPEVDPSEGYYYRLGNTATLDIHPNDKGHSAIADAAASFLAPQ
ncbi:GDSL-type esterase/lipase family protein [Actinoplanes sp. URMC 104]|uniref:GDSL-type esterase/lipase family protein n=1 Tax=Actinoplanes sp. URMC 104 TaxID=3423409 RepID=UPI003F1B5082